MHSDTETAYGSTDTDGAALDRALERLFSPISRLCLENGMMFAKAEEMLKQSFIEAAQTLHPDLPEHGKVSRIAAATGINRREVTRLVRARAPRRIVRLPLASEVIARWTADPVYRDVGGVALPLKRQGEAPSFESLAQAITRDLHPRSILEEMLRLGIVRHDQETDRIFLLCNEYVPGGDAKALLTLLGENVGDHLESAVANLLQDDIQHHEQAVFANELSEESIKAVAPLIMAHWHQLRDDLVPALTELIEADQKAGRPQSQRLRIGLYSFSEAETHKEPVNEIVCNE